MPLRRSLGWPITLGVVMIVLLVALTIGWVVVNVSAAHWAVLAIGATFLGILIVGVVAYLVLSIKAFRLNQRQSNFIDSVTHELKSPIASLKLCLQTLSRHQLSPEQESDFHRFMLEDLQRLDNLINHLLDAARLDQEPVERGFESVDLAAVVDRCIESTLQSYRLPAEAIKRHLEPATIYGRPMDLEMIFRNLLDNAVKYAGKAPEVFVDLFRPGGQRVRVRISDNGPGIPFKLRRKIFGRFVRLGSELERSKPGTGLGLYIVRTLVKRMHGQVTVRGRGSLSGTVFEVDLPATNGQARGNVE
jgi:two-component system, OmpR family, phosphate regulon sensor histidine kinase PhoR